MSTEHAVPGARLDVLFIDDICRELRVSRRTVERLRSHGCFPIPEMLSLDARPRWSREAVERFKAKSAGAGRAWRRHA